MTTILTAQEALPIIETAKAVRVVRPDSSIDEIIDLMRKQMMDNDEGLDISVFVESSLLPMRKALDMLRVTPNAPNVLLARRLGQWTRDEAERSVLNNQEIDNLTVSMIVFKINGVLEELDGDDDDETVAAAENLLLQTFFKQLDEGAMVQREGDRPFVDQAVSEVVELVQSLLRSKQPLDAAAVAKDAAEWPERHPALFELLGAELRQLRDGGESPYSGRSARR